MGRRRRVRVPGSSANLGPGFDAMAAALSVHMELEVSEAGSFSVASDVEETAMHSKNGPVGSKFESSANANWLMTHLPATWS